MKLALQRFQYGPLTSAGRDDLTAHGSSSSTLRQAKYFPVPGGDSIGPGTKRRMIGSRKNFCAMFRCSGVRSGRNPSTSGPVMTKSLLPRVTKGELGFSVTTLLKCDISINGIGGSVVALYG